MAADHGDDEPRRPWFGPKRHGVGIGPTSWQGWLVTIGGGIVVVVLVKLVAHG